MEGFALTTATATANTTKPYHIRLILPLCSPKTRTRVINVSFPRKPSKFRIFACNDKPKLNRLDQMELKFGRLIGEDPKLTLAKIMSRKLDPDVSYMEVEKSFYKNKGKSMPDDIEEVPFNGSEKRKSSNSLNGLNLVRPVPKKGVKFEVDSKPIGTEVKKRSQPVTKPVVNNRDALPNVILRKPTIFNEDDIESQESSKSRIKTNMSLNIGKEKMKEKFSDIALLKKPELVSGNSSLDKKLEPYAVAKAEVVNDIAENSQITASEFTEATNDVTLIARPTQIDVGSFIDEQRESFDDRKGSISGIDLVVNNLEGLDSSSEKVNTTQTNYAESIEAGNASISRDSGLEDYSITGLQPLEQSETASSEKSTTSEMKLMDSYMKFAAEAALQGNPERLNQSVRATSDLSRAEMASVDPKSYIDAFEPESSVATSLIKETEDNYWKRVEVLCKTGAREDVELISSSTKGFVVSFGSLVGFLPYRNLAPRWKFLAFESWLRRKSLDPSKYKSELSIIGYNGTASMTSLDSSVDPERDRKVDMDISPDMKLEELLRIYDQEKLKFLSSFIGQKVKVRVVLADRKSRKLIVSVNRVENEEIVEKKRTLMAKLSIGDVVTCRITKIAYFGIFVEVEGVPALIHMSEVSWDATLDPSSYYQIGQIVEAKVRQLDFLLERILLSLKEITADPLLEASEAVIGDHDSIDGRLEAAQAATEWADVESLIKELQQFEGVRSVSKGRFFLSSGLAPTFQVYMASRLENEYKLLARAGNRVQEVIVETSLGKEEMKSAILSCAKRV